MLDEPLNRVDATNRAIMSALILNVCRTQAQVGVFASSLAERVPGYTSLGFPNPRPLAR